MILDIVNTSILTRKASLSEKTRMELARGGPFYSIEDLLNYIDKNNLW